MSALIEAQSPLTATLASAAGSPLVPPTSPPSSLGAHTHTHTPPSAALYRRTAKRMLRVAVYAAAARIAYGVLKLVLKGRILTPGPFLRDVFAEVFSQNPFKWAWAASLLSSYRAVQQHTMLLSAFSGGRKDKNEEKKKDEEKEECGTSTMTSSALAGAIVGTLGILVFDASTRNEYIFIIYRFIPLFTRS